MVQERNQEHKVNLTNPSTAIVVEIMKNICGLSVIRDYYQLSKYNLNSLYGPEVSTEDTKTSHAEVPEDEAEKKEKGD